MVKYLFLFTFSYHLMEKNQSQPIYHNIACHFEGYMQEK